LLNIFLFFFTRHNYIFCLEFIEEEEEEEEEEEKRKLQSFFTCSYWIFEGLESLIISSIF